MNQQMEQIDREAITPSNPVIREVAKRIRATPEKLVGRIELALPTAIARLSYLQLSENGLSMYPESFVKIWMEIVGDQELTLQDLSENGRAMSVFESILQTVEILDLDRQELLSRLSVRNAARFVNLFGANTKDLLQSVYDNIDEIAGMMHWSFISRSKLIFLALKHILWVAENYPTSTSFNALEYFQNRYEVGGRLYGSR